MKNKLFLLIVGILSFPVFSQCLEGDCIDGKGKYESNYGDVYTGDFQNYERTGFGKLEINSGSRKGSKYEGEFLKGKFQGSGRYTYSDGSFEEGIWENDEFVSEYPKNYKKPKRMVSSTKRAKNKSVASVKKSEPTKPKKVPTTRKCECCGIVFKIVNGWGYRNSLGNVKVFQFGEPDELALDILTTNIGTSMGYSEDQIGYHSNIKYHSKRCAYDCGN